MNMNWITNLIAFLIGVCGVLPIFSSYKGDNWQHKIYKRFVIRSKPLALYGGVGVIILTIIQWYFTTSESAVLQTKNRLLFESNAELTQKLTGFSGIHDIYPRFYLFRGSILKYGTAEELGSRIQILIENPGAYPIYDVDVKIVEVLEKMKWQSEFFSGIRTRRHIERDSTGNVIFPAFVAASFHFDIFYPKQFIQEEITAPPSAGKSDYVYYIDASAKNGQFKYKYHFVKEGETSNTPLISDDFYRAYKIFGDYTLKASTKRF